MPSRYDCTIISNIRASAIYEGPRASARLGTFRAPRASGASGPRPTLARATDTAADAARIVLETRTALRSGDGIPAGLAADHDPKCTSALFKELTRRIGFESQLDSKRRCSRS